MESTMDTTQDSINPNTSINKNILECPKCRNKIPQYSWKLTNTKLSFSIDCKDCDTSIMDFYNNISEKKQPELRSFFCPRNIFHHSALSSKYCINCQKWICKQCINSHELFGELQSDLIPPRKLGSKTKCFIHPDLELNYYCKDCHITLCKQCKEQSHSNHSVDNIKKIKALQTKEYFQYDLQLAEETIQEYKRKTNKILSLLDNKINYLIGMKKDLESVYTIYEHNSYALKTFAQNLYHNAELIHEENNEVFYSNFKEQFTININNPIISYEKPEEDAMTLICYFRSNCIYQHSKTVKLITKLDLNNSNSTAMIVTTNNKLLCGYNSGSILIYNLKLMLFESSFLIHRNKVQILLELKDKRIVSVANDETIAILDISKPIQRNIIKTLYTETITEVIELKNLRIASGSNNNTIKLWSTYNYTFLSELKTGNIIPLQLSLVENGVLVAGMSDYSIQIWKNCKQKEMIMLGKHTNKITTLIKLKRNILASSSFDACIIIWDTQTCNQIKKIHLERPINKMYYLNPDTLLFYTEINVGMININESKKKYWNTPQLANANILVYLRDGRIVVQKNKFIYVWSFC